MNVLRRLIPVVMMAVPLFGVAANEKDSVAVGSVIDEVIWVVGDEAILRSDVEAMRMQSAMEGVKWSGNPDCIIPEQIAVQKLFKHQAAIDSIEVTDADVAQEVEQQINYWLDMVDGSRERLEEYKHQPLSQIRNELRDELKDRQMVQRMKRKLVEDISVTPAEVRRYFKDMPLDSLPFVPTEVEVQIIQMTPRIEVEELNRVKDELRDYTDRVNKGELRSRRWHDSIPKTREQPVVVENLVWWVVVRSILPLPPSPSTSPIRRRCRRSWSRSSATISSNSSRNVVRK